MPLFESSTLIKASEDPRRLTESALLADSQNGCGLERTDGSRDKGSSGDERSGKHDDGCVVLSGEIVSQHVTAEKVEGASNLELSCLTWKMLRRLN